MKLEIASATLRRARATAQRRSLEKLVERLTPLAPSDDWLARLGQTARKPHLTQTQRCPS